MDSLQQALEWIQNLVFLAVTVWALRRWRRTGSEQSRWLAATFLALTVAIGVAIVIRDLPDGAAVAVLGRLTLAVLLPFPYLLLRFLDSFEPVQVMFRRVAGLAVGLTVVWGMFLPDLDEEAASADASVQLYVIVVVTTWLTILAYVARRFWLAGRGQPTMVRRRLRTLSLATVSLSAAMLLAGTQADAGGAMSLFLQLFALASAGLFLVGFAPPPALRLLWRQTEEAQFHTASAHLMGATSPQEVADLLVPHLRTVVAARAVALVHDGSTIAVDGATDDDLSALDARATDSREFALSNGTIHVWLNAYTPFFGEEEYTLLQRLALLADLAIDRTTLLELQMTARAQLETANEELESFIYSASHDLKSPLIALLSYIDLLQTDYGGMIDDEGRWYLDRMQSNCHFMESLVTDLLELSRVGRVETTSHVVDLTSLVATIADETVRQHPGLRVQAESLPDLYMNDVRARQLFANLIENAAAYGGRDDAVIEVFTREPTSGTDGTIVVVRDNGRGIPPRYRDRVFGVFERLQTEAESASGTGMGLAICRKIADSTGGWIRLTDHEGGAEFEILFPPDALADGEHHAMRPHTEVSA